MQQLLTIPFTKQRSDKREIAATYYRLFSAYFNLGLTDLQVKVMAHLAVNNGVASGGNKQKFLESYNVSKPSLDNLICRLKKKKLLISNPGTKKAAQLHPRLLIDFNNQNFKFEFNCSLSETEAQ